jgi:serine/threonine-protein kinase
MDDQLERLTTALADRYAIEREIGSGGMATVFLAEDLKHRRSVAIKTLRPELAATLGPERFLREIEIAARLDHPHILPLYDSGIAGGELYYVMPYVEGETLRQRLLREGQLPVEEALRIAWEIADALSYAHSRDVVHRDIKPENVLLAGDHARVADFGIARAISVAGSDQLTGTGMSVGTPAYMSPEQASGAERLDGRSDIYSLGCVLYEMLAGDPPFTGSNPQAILARKLTGTAPGLRLVREALPGRIEQLALKALERVPADRFATAAQFAEALRADLVPGAVRSAATERIDSLAVLPFQDLSQDRDLEYFADGMTEELITELGRIGAVGKVISRTSIMGYKERRPPIQEIGRALGVRGLVEASVRHAADSVRITVRLVDAASDTQIWSKSFQRELTDILSLYGDVARAIADEIEAELTPRAEIPTSRARRVNPRAYDAYLKGNSFLNQGTPQGFPRAIECFTEATALDPEFAPAYAGLADTYSTLGELYVLPSREAFAKGKLEAGKALAIDPNLAEAHFELAWATDRLEWDWLAAEREYRRAIELNEGYEPAHRWYGLSLVYRGQVERGIAELERASELDPLAPMAHLVCGVGLYCARRYDASVAHLERIIALDPTHPLPHWFLSLPYLEQSRPAEAVASGQKAVTLGGPQPLFLAFLGFAYGRIGRRDEAQRIVDELTDRSSQEYISPDIFAKILTGMGERELAIDWLERAYEERAYGVIHLRSFPMYDSLRGDPRFERMVEAVTPLGCAEER